MSTPEKQLSSADDDAALLHKLGYAQVLYREMGGFSNFAISFTIISILAGCLTSYYIAFNSGGPVAVTWGWLLVGVFCVLVAMAMGEIASAMPTAGALYYWASKLGGPAWGWFTGWFNLIGQIAVTAAIDYGAATFTTALLSLWFPEAIGTDTGAIFITYTVILALHLGLNLANVNILSLLNTVSAWWHMAGVAVIVAILIIVPERHQSAAYVFGETINNTGFSDTAFWFVFGLGLLMSQYTITGYDASAHMSEETRSASRSAAVGMVMSVVVSVIFGFILLVAVTYAIPFTPDGLPDSANVAIGGGTADAPTPGNAVVYIWTTSLGNAWAEFLLFIAVVAQFFCGTASVTSASRMMFAFSRDRAVPFSTLWRKVSANRVPVNAVIAIAVLSWALMIPTLANGTVGYAVGTSIAVIGLYIAFALPIILRIKAGDSFEGGSWSLGRHYKWIAPLAVAWIAIVCVLFLLPAYEAGVPWSPNFTWLSVNYAPITVGGALILFGGWYLLSAKNWFTGPVREDTASIEEALEKEAEASLVTSSVGAASAATASSQVEAPVAASPATDATATTAAEPAKDEAAKDEPAKDEPAKDEPAKDGAGKAESAEDAVAAKPVPTEDAVAAKPEPVEDAVAAKVEPVEDATAAPKAEPEEDVAAPKVEPAEDAAAPKVESTEAVSSPEPVDATVTAEPSDSSATAGSSDSGSSGSSDSGSSDSGSSSSSTSTSDSS